MNKAIDTCPGSQFNSMGETENGGAEFKAGFLIKALVGYLYFMQGVFLSFISAIAYLYPVYPDALMLSNFSIAYLPFSFKFLTAPIVEKFAPQSYGRRKFWITMALLVSAILTFPLAYIADKPEQHMVVVGIMFVIILMVSMGDIALDAASVKELEDPALAGYLQASMQSIGGLVARLIIINASNPTYWSFIGLEGQLCSTETLFIAIGLGSLVMAVAIHFAYKERIIAEEEEDDVPEFKSIFKFYLHFLKPRYELCRTAICFLVVYQGVKFFRLNFENEAIYQGYPKEQVLNIDNICMFIAFGTNTLLAKLLTKANIFKYFIGVNVVEVVVCTGFYFMDSFEEAPVTAALYFIHLLSYTRFLINSTLVNSFGHSKYAGLCLTTLNSFINFGQHSWLQLKIKADYGYYPAVGGGFVLAWITALLIKPFMAWVQRGEPETHEHEHKE